MDALDFVKNSIANLIQSTDENVDNSATLAHESIAKARTTKTAGRFQVQENGVFLVKPGKGDEDGSLEFVCSKLEVVAMIRDPHSDQWGRLLQWKDPDDRFHEWAMPMSALQSDGAEVRRDLAAGGVTIGQSLHQRQLLICYLTEADSKLRIRGIDKTGWYHGSEGPVFVLPDQVVGKSSEQFRFQSDTRSRAYRVTGTAEGWRTEVAALCAGNSRCILALCTGFASMLLEFSGLESGGINLKGSSSTGKTTSLAAAASIFGGPDYINRWRATSNGLEGQAVLHNHTLLILDELAQVDPREAGEIAYMLANGQGKQRSARTGSAKPRQTWKLLFLSAGEIGLAQHMAEGGKKAKAGQEVRLVDLEADAGNGFGLFDTLHGHQHGAALSTAIKTGAARHHGHAVLEFAAVLAEGAEKWPDHIRQEIDFFVQNCLPDAESGGQVHRVCERFALIAVAGELATSNHITGWQPGEALDAVQRCFAEWLNARGATTNSEPAAMIEAVRSFISKHEESRFTDLDFKVEDRVFHRPTTNRAGWRRTGINGKEYFVDPNVFKTELCGGFDVLAVCRVLDEAGCLLTKTEAGKTRYSIKRQIHGEQPRVYVITSRIWEA